MTKLLIANRGEIAVRIARAAADLEIPTVAVYSEDDAPSLHVRVAGEARALEGVGAAPYLDIAQVVAAAVESGCDALHPGYGFLSENADLARRCAEAGIAFVGPEPETLALFGDKTEARALAERTGVAVLPGTARGIELEAVRAFLATHGAMLLKAVSGGGGWGTRAVRDVAELEEAFTRATSEAAKSFGDGSLFAERLLPRARHIEVQILGDGSGRVCPLGERDCSMQRRFQKLVEIAPAPFLPEALRGRIHEAAVRLAEATQYRNAGTFEFLVDASDFGNDSSFFFLETNPRLQVEHTVTEEVTGVDLVQAQLRIATGASLADLGLDPEAPLAIRGCAVQVRVNAETMGADGIARPGGGRIETFGIPSGRGVRTDTHAYAGYEPSPRFDSLLAKVIGHAEGYEPALRRTYRALCELDVAGIPTNVAFLQNLLRHPALARGELDTAFVDEHLAELLGSNGAHPQLRVERRATAPRVQAGAAIDRSDPLASLEFFRSEGSAPDRSAPTSAAGRAGERTGPAGTAAVRAPMQGTVIELEIAENDVVHAGQTIAVMEAVKMEHVVKSDVSGIVRLVAAAVGDTVLEAWPLLFVEEVDVGEGLVEEERAVDLETVPEALAGLRARLTMTLDDVRPEAVAKRHAQGGRTGREYVADLMDPDTFVEYGALAVAAQRQRRSLEELIHKTPADGLITGIGCVNGERFGSKRSRTILCAYDALVLAGTQGLRGHHKTDRMSELALELDLPLVFHAAGAGGRSGDTDIFLTSGMDTRMWEHLAKLSGRVPTIATIAGRCFAGNAAVAGLLDVIVATENSNIGIGGPAMIEGAGLGAYRTKEIGPMSDQVPNGVVDVAVRDEGEMIRAVKQLLSYYQGPIADWECADQRALRHVVPENRKRAYDVRAAIHGFADSGSVLELRPNFGLGMVTAFVRVEGRPLAVIANDNRYLGGAIDSAGGDKAARFVQLADAWGVPILTLIDTPGNMVGPEVEKTAVVRHTSRVFLAFANVEVPVFSIVLRKCFGLGALAMYGGSSKSPVSSVAWPGAQFGGANLEGTVKLGMRDELAAIADPAERATLFEQVVAQAYENGSGINVATNFDIDAVIDPADTRRWLVDGLDATPPSPRPRPKGERGHYVDAW